MQQGPEVILFSGENQALTHPFKKNTNKIKSLPSCSIQSLHESLLIQVTAHGCRMTTNGDYIKSIKSELLLCRCVNMYLSHYTINVIKNIYHCFTCMTVDTFFTAPWPLKSKRRYCPLLAESNVGQSPKAGQWIVWEDLHRDILQHGPTLLHRWMCAL